MTVDGCTYERSYIEQWIRHRQQQKMRVTSPATNQELTSHRLLSLIALRKAIEAYLVHRPELTASHLASRSFEEAAGLLQKDLFEKQAIHANAEDELSLLRDSNEVLFRNLRVAESTCTGLREELKHTRMKVCQAEGDLRREREDLARLDGGSDDHAVVAACEEDTAGGSSAVRPRRVAGVDSHDDSTPEFEDDSCSQGGGHVDRLDDPKHEGLERIESPALRGALSPEKSRSRQASGRSGFLHLAAVMTIALLMVFAPRLRDRKIAAPTEPVSTLSENLSSHEAADHPHEALAAAPAPVVPSIAAAALSPPSVQPKLHKEVSKDTKKDKKKRKGDIKKKVSSNQDDLLILQQVQLLRSGNSDQRTEAALLLGILAASSPDNQASIVRAGAIPPLVELLKSSAPDARGQAAVALRTLASNNTYNKVAIVRAGAIPPLIKLLRDDNLEVQEVAAGALQTIAETNNQVEIAQAGAIVPLVALLKDHSPTVREEAAGALVILSLNADNQVAIAQVGAIPLLVDLLKDEASEVREQAAAALRNLAAENADNQIEIARAGALAPLSALLSDSMPGVREEALAALRNIAAQEPGNSGSATTDVSEAAVAAGFAIKEAAALAAGLTARGR